MSDEHNLSPREHEVLALLVTGATDQAISARLGIGYSTVKTHVKHIIQKLGAYDRHHAAMIALEAGLIRPGELP